ncbi:MAG: peptidylprolyl isomerase [Fimbriimonadaceae bacterium]|nr:peptidylprolyl isomerase [Fimbriimonadaceae bacterium]
MSSRTLWTALLLACCTAAQALEIALLPPVADDPTAAAIRSAAAEIGVTVAVLEPAQVIDPARFSPTIYAMAVLVGGERYPDTVIDEGDAALALQAYIDAGGAFLVAASGPVLSRPQRWNGSEWRSIPAPVRRMQTVSKLGLLDAGLPLESAAPTGSQLAVTSPSVLASKLPDRFAAPAGTFLPIPANQESGINFAPLATLVDPQGGTYGAAMAQLRRPAPSRGATYYCWAPLLAAAQGRDLLLGLLTLHAGETMTSEQAARRDELLGQIQQLDRAHRQAGAVLPADLHTAEVDALRQTLGQQADTLRWLREACGAGNLSFVAMRLQKLREELGDLPARVGRAVDQAVQDAVAAAPGGRTELPLEPPRTSSGNPRGPQDAAVDGTLTVVTATGLKPPTEVAPADDQRQPPRERPAPAVAAGGPAAQPVGTSESGGLLVAGVPTPSVEAPRPPETTARTAPGGATPGGTTPGGTTPGGTTPGGTTPGGTTPGGTTPDKPRFATANPVVEFEIKGRGKVCIELLPAEAPKTASAFLYLVRSGFYDGTYFHRRVARFVVQGGDPLSKTRSPDDPEVGTGGPAWTVPGEFSDKATHRRGTVGLARAPHDPNSGGSQFYICLEPQPSLDREYAIFGQVIDGLELIDKIQVGDRILATRIVQGAEPTNPEGVKPLDLFKK